MLFMVSYDEADVGGANQLENRTVVMDLSKLNMTTIGIRK